MFQVLTSTRFVNIRIAQPHLVQCLDIVQVALWPLLCGLGEVSVELGGVCLRVRLDGGDKRGLLLLTSLLASFCDRQRSTRR